jgi:tellurium resistance protein TerD
MAELKIYEHSKITFSLRWELCAFRNTTDIDLDLAALLLAEDGRVLHDDFWIFYNNLYAPDMSALHSGDSALHEDATAFENILINFDYMNEQIHEIVFLANLHAGKISQDLRIRAVIADVVHGEILEEKLLTSGIIASGAAEICRIFKLKNNWLIEWQNTNEPENIAQILDKYI